MIFANIDSPSTNNILGYETGTRAVFDARHGGDPLWVFLDYNVVKNRANTADFIARPKAYHIDGFGNLRLRS
jgi:hypothetical protein